MRWTRAALLAERCHAEASEAREKTWGQCFTSPAVAAFMAGLVAVPRGDRPLRMFRFTLGYLGLDVSTGPVVPFRAAEALLQEPKRAATVPMLWLQHVRSTGVTWPLGDAFRKPEHILTSASAKLLVPSTTYVLVRRFSAKEEHRRLVAAPLHEGALPGASLGLESHLNFIHRPRGKLTGDEAIAIAIAALLNSSLFDAYFRISSGNTQVSATELRLLPLPSPEVLARVAKAVKKRGIVAADDIVEELVHEAA